MKKLNEKLLSDFGNIVYLYRSSDSVKELDVKYKVSQVTSYNTIKSNSSTTQTITKDTEFTFKTIEKKTLRGK